MKRRELLKKLALLPLAGGTIAGGLAGCNSLGRSATDGGEDPHREFKDQLYEEIGIRPTINGRGSWTYMGGMEMLPETKRVITATSNDFFNLHELNDKIGEKIAELVNTEAAMVTSGAAGAMLLGTAATITGKNQVKIDLLPDLPGPRPEVIVQKAHRNNYDHAVRTCGVRMIEVESARELEAAVNENTVMMLFMHHLGDDGPIGEEEFVALGKKHDVPTFVDAAGASGDTILHYPEIGFDLTAVSGGKAVAGPQSSGLLFGRRDLIEAARLNHSPNEAPIGRPLKVNKEEMIALYVALRLHLQGGGDGGSSRDEWNERANWIRSEIETIPTVDGGSDDSSWIRLNWDQNVVRITPREVYEQLRSGTPSIETSGFFPDVLRPDLKAWTEADVENYNASDAYLGLTARREGGIDEIRLTLSTIKPREDRIVAERIKEILGQAVAT
ncbi:MAG: aminotransferase class V-fold PLP-dependent enzyme [Balneolaceae bacterium]